MKRDRMALMGAGALLVVNVTALDAQDGKSMVSAHIEEHGTTYGAIAQDIWDLAEVGYLETESSGLLQRTLGDAGFTVTPGVAGMPTAFVAEYGRGEPVIAILAEFDALPGITQDRSPERAPRPDMGAGHACGHHLFAAGSTAAAIAVKEWLDASGTPGTIRLYGTPAEEGGAGKVYMVREGLFDDVGAVLHWHAGDRNAVWGYSSLANKSAKFRFYGVSAHAAGAPERARSALDGVEAMNLMVNMLREHVPQETRIHYVITAGGNAPNVTRLRRGLLLRPEPGSAERAFHLRAGCGRSGGRGQGHGHRSRIRGHPRHLQPPAQRGDGRGHAGQPGTGRRRGVRR
jgi:aminobenzoyl-glutamate utilization protein B